MRTAIGRAGAVLLAWVAVLAAEHVAIGFGYRRMFVGTWEMDAARTAVSPVVVAALVPVAAAVVLLLEGAKRPSWRIAAVLACAAFGGATGYGVSFGRHMAAWSMRGPFVFALAAAGAGVGVVVLPRLVRAAKNHVGVFAAGASVAAAGLWCVDAFVLPRLYPAFHTAVLALMLLAAALPAWAAAVASGPRAFRWGAGGLGVALLGGVWAPYGVRRLAAMDNLKIVLVEHAPLLGRGVRIATWLWPDATASTAGVGQGRTFAEVGRSLDWTGRDILLLSVDALRADHVSSYGYPRRTTPAIDALARRGTSFDAAYCPTPHTSYSVTSMMTGKYMRPLLALGIGEDSQTWAAYLRTYGYRTAAFYPPAVFFIDEPKFHEFSSRGLYFEYRKEEFAAPPLRRSQVRAYLDAPEASSTPLFLWVHFFEPHEPYVMHAEHPFGEEGHVVDLDAYDSEIAAADEGIGWIVEEVERRRPGAVVIVTADHGEEFGDHGGRYHGTTVYEEQVRVPMLVVGPGVAVQRVRTPVQTVDLLPTALSALGVPRPARVRGRDLGPLLAGTGAADDPGFALAETDERSLLAQGDERLVCMRKAGACALYDVRADPHETRDVGPERRADLERLRAELANIASEQGKFETSGAALPEALRRGMQGDVDADVDVAALLDDADVGIRQKAAAVLFELRSARVAEPLRRALRRDEDARVRILAALALARSGQPVPGEVYDRLTGGDREWRRLAALALAERGDARPAVSAELVAWWSSEGPPGTGLEFGRARDLLHVFGALQARAASPVIARSLGDVRLRAFVAEALGLIGDRGAIAPLLGAFEGERYPAARLAEARALVRLGATGELRVPLARFAGAPEPMVEAVGLARDAGLLDRAHGGFASKEPARNVRAVLAAPGGARRLFVLTGAVVDAGSPSAVTLRIDGALVPLPARSDALRLAELEASPAAEVTVDVTTNAKAEAGIVAIWLVSRVDGPMPVH